ncbi:MAG: CPBP family intramembrane metalloprotease [Candidatus Omnitrophica bacterium]|nr:CPBP family intramembrane metalloprotease [Candidatus Omnitrophota bacterium]
MGPAISNHTPSQGIPQHGPPICGIQERREDRAHAIQAIARFGVGTLVISTALALVVSPWLHLPLWTIIRRCVSIGAAISLWLSIKKFERRSFRSYGLFASRAGRRQLLFGLLLGAGAIGLLFAIGLLSGTCQIAITPDRPKLWWTVLSFIPIAILVSVLEELVFRGFLLQHLMAFSKPMAVTVSSVLYALVHMKTAAWSLGLWCELIGLFLLGSVLALSYLATKQLYLAIGLHASLAYGARVNKLVVHFLSEPPITWIMGTGRLVNGLVGWTLLVVLGVGMVLWRTRPSQRGGTQYGET